ncbi:GIY-YIG nuclease family protein (plasmid) [Streptomyces sp. NBC_01259]|uniref:GIY-YIG nuclease family protein n=1 Tax=Streptomyces sp. NBC_01259 TaxID=2903800 RepID=UPI002F90F7F2
MTSTLCAVNGCTEHLFIEHPLPLCRRDALMVSLNVTDILHSTALLGGQATGLDVERVSVAPEHVWGQPSHQPVVYFLANGDRVKIGVSTNISARVLALSFRRENALLLVQGSYGLESALHAHFKCDRITRTEWFVLSSGIRDYIDRRKQADAAMRQPSITPQEANEPAVPAPAVPRVRPATADERILSALKDLSDQLGFNVNYVAKGQIAAAAKIDGSTFANALTKLIKAGKIHRQVRGGREVTGKYGIGPAPSTES